MEPHKQKDGNATAHKTIGKRAGNFCKPRFKTFYPQTKENKQTRQIEQGKVLGCLFFHQPYE